VIIAVLNVTFDALDMLATATVFILLLFHVIVLLSFLAKYGFAENERPSLSQVQYSSLTL